MSDPISILGVPRGPVKLPLPDHHPLERSSRSRSRYTKRMHGPSMALPLTLPTRLKAKKPSLASHIVRPLPTVEQAKATLASLEDPVIASHAKRALEFQERKLSVIPYEKEDNGVYALTLTCRIAQCAFESRQGLRVFQAYILEAKVEGSNRRIKQIHEDLEEYRKSQEESKKDPKALGFWTSKFNSIKGVVALATNFSYIAGAMLAPNPATIGLAIWAVSNMAHEQLADHGVYQSAHYYFYEDNESAKAFQESVGKVVFYANTTALVATPVLTFSSIGIGRLADGSTMKNLLTAVSDNPLSKAFLGSFKNAQLNTANLYQINRGIKSGLGMLSASCQISSAYERNEKEMYIAEADKAEATVQGLTGDSDFAGKQVQRLLKEETKILQRAAEAIKNEARISEIILSLSYET